MLTTAFGDTTPQRKDQIILQTNILIRFTKTIITRSSVIRIMVVEICGFKILILQCNRVGHGFFFKNRTCSYPDAAARIGQKEVEPQKAFVVGLLHNRELIGKFNCIFGWSLAWKLNTTIKLIESIVNSA